MRSPLFTLVRKEIAELKRDRRVLLFTLILPVLIYPAVVGMSNRMQEEREHEVKHRTLAVALAPADPRIETKLREDASLTLVPGSVDSLRALVESRRVAAAVVAPREIAPVGAAAPDTIRIIVDRTRENGREAAERIKSALAELRAELRQERWREATAGEELRSTFGVRSVDVATATEASGAEASRMLVYLLLMTLFMAGSAFSNDIVAGEKERGTLETLFLAPVERSLIARSKWIVVAGGTTLTGALSLLSLSATYSMGFLSTGEGQSFVLDPSTLLTVALLILPLAALLGSVLLVVSAWARSLKEAQYYMLPVMMLVFVPALLSMNQSIELSPFVALLPIANVAFVMRDVLAQQASMSMVVLVMGATVGWTVLMGRWVTQLLTREETVLGFDPEPFFARTEGGRGRATFVGMALTVLGFFYLGQWMQSRDLVVGLALSLWVLLPVLASGTVALVRPVRLDVVDLLSLRPASLRAFVGAALLGWGAMLPIASGLTKLQSYVLPMPASQMDGFGGLFEGLALWQLVVLASLSPAICEELVFRGVFLGLLRQRGATRSAVLWSSFFFALIHLSIYRLAPTFLLGVALALLVVRHRSIFPAMLLHFVYNGTLLVGAVWFEDREPPVDFEGFTAWALSLALLAGGFFLADLGAVLRPRREQLP